MLIDVHAHFYHEHGPRRDWQQLNQARLTAGDRIGITTHVSSILGTWGMRSPTYFPSAADVTLGNAAQLGLQRQHPRRIRGYITVNPNYTAHALDEIRGGVIEGMVGLKLAASRRCDDPLLDPICDLVSQHGLPVLHHIWQHRRRDWPGQEASDAVELCRLALRHPEVHFILAHIGGGGDWLHSLRALRHQPNIFIDLSGSGVDGGMLESCLFTVGSERLLWGADVTLCTGLAKLRYLEHILTPADLELVRYRNAERIFPPGAFA